jgi:Domain of unknown function (DUF1990)
VRIIWRLFGEKPSLSVLSLRPLSPGIEKGPGPTDRRDRYERIVAHEEPGVPQEGDPFRRLVRAVLAYDIFPASLVTGVLPRNPLQVGDTYGICYHFLPGIDLLFPAGVIARFEGPEGDVWRAGFTLCTVVGHPMVGEETFWIEKDLAGGAVSVGIRSWSRPGMWLTRLAAPWLRRVQVRACHAALRHLEAIACRPPETPGTS